MGIQTSFNPGVPHTFKGPQFIQYTTDSFGNPYGTNQQMGFSSDLTITESTDGLAWTNAGSSQKLTYNANISTPVASNITNELIDTILNVGAGAAIQNDLLSLWSRISTSPTGGAAGGYTATKIGSSRDTVSIGIGTALRPVNIGLVYGHEIEAIAIPGGGNTTVTKLSALKIGDMSGAATNLAIETGLGIVRLGDKIEMLKAAGANSINLSSVAGTARTYLLSTGGLSRFGMNLNGVAEGGGDSGSNLEFQAYTDAGGIIDNWLTVARAAGGQITIGGNPTRTLSTTGNLNVETSFLIGICYLFVPLPYRGADVYDSML
jgi:hypothetical protein